MVLFFGMFAIMIAIAIHMVLTGILMAWWNFLIFLSNVDRPILYLDAFVLTIPVTICLIYVIIHYTIVRDKY